MTTYRLIFLFIFSFSLSQFVKAEDSDDADDSDDIREQILAPGATASTSAIATATGNGRRVRFLRNPLYPSNPNRGDWIMQTVNNMQHVPTAAREQLNYQIYFNKYVGSKEKYIDVYFEGDYVYIASCSAKLYFDNPYNNRIGRYYFHQPKCKDQVVKLSVGAAQRRLSSNLRELTLQILLPPQGLAFIKTGLDLVHNHLKEVVPRDRSEFEEFVDELFDVTPQPNNNAWDFAVGLAEQAVNLAQDTLNLFHLQGEPEESKVVSVENFENFKRDLKRIILQMHANSFPPPASTPKPIR